MSVLDRFKAGGISPINPPAEVVEQLKNLDAARAAGVGVAGLGGRSATEESHLMRLHELRLQQAQMEANPQIQIHQAVDRQIDAMDALNQNITRLCNLLETLQLSVLPRD